jgi:hypothetical protein
MGPAPLEGLGMKKLGILLLASCAWLAHGSDLPAASEETPTVIVIVGAAGEKDYGVNFANWAKLWEQACQKANAQFIPIGLDPNKTNDLQIFKQTLEHEPKDGTRDLWLVFLGHGTFDGKEAKFNLRGPDLSAAELAMLLESIHRPLAIIDTASASSPFLAKLSGEGRVVITATRSGYEQNYARFGQFFSAAIADPNADLDKDGQVSLLEAFLMSAHQLAEFYTTQGRLASEHPLIDDNGDGLGTPPDWFRGTRAVKKPAQGTSVDGLRANQFHLIRSEAERKLSPAVRLRRNELELAILHLRDTKDTVPVDEYYQELEKLMLELARLYEGAESPKSSQNP